MNIFSTKTQIHFKDAWSLTKKSLFKTIEFQILFKVFYISILLFILQLLFKIFFDATDTFLTHIHLGEATREIPILSLFDLKLIATLIVSLFTIIYISLIEKNGVMIITAEYYKNNYISFFEVLYRSVRKTPQFIFARIKEMRTYIFVFIGSYIIWKICNSLSLSDWFINLFTVLLFLYGTVIILVLLFRYRFTAYIIFLEPTESSATFNKNISKEILKKITYLSIIFYAIFFVTTVLWILIFVITIRTILFFSFFYPSIASTFTTFFVAFTIVSVFIILSALKTFTMSMLTTLYYTERKNQQKKITIHKQKNQPLFSQNLILTVTLITSIALICGILLTSTLKTKINTIINDTQNYITQINSNQIPIYTTINENNIKKSITDAQSQNLSTFKKIEKIILSLFAYSIQK